MSNPISAAYLEGKLRSIVAVERGNPLSDLQDVIRGLLVLENDRAEWRMAAGDALAAASHTQAAGGAGTFAQEALENPANSGLIVVVTAVNSSITALLRIATSAAIAAFATAGERVFRDGRLAFDNAGLQVFPGAVLRNAAVAGLAGFDFWLMDRDSGTQGYVFTQQPDAIAVLPPGTALNVQAATANVAMRADFLFYQRPLEGRLQIK